MAPSRAHPATVIDHPVVAHHLGELRNAATSSDRFRAILATLSGLLAYETLRDLATEPTTVVTPVGMATAAVVAEHVLLVPVLRAGLGMVSGIQSVVPDTEVAHLGMRRNEVTLEASVYLDGLPADLSERRVLICDPMLATGGSLTEAVRLVRGRGAMHVAVLSVVVSAPGLSRFTSIWPNVPVTCAAIDPNLDDRGYIIPGLGDAGDRLFGQAPPG